MLNRWADYDAKIAFETLHELEQEGEIMIGKPYELGITGVHINTTMVLRIK